MDRTPSRLGREVEDAIVRSGAFERFRDDVQYMCFYRSKKSGRHFGFERVTESAIRIWLPPTPAILAALSGEGMNVPEVSRPLANPDDPERYGRISSLKHVPELRDLDLLPVPVTSGAQALRVLSAL